MRKQEILDLNEKLKTLADKYREDYHEQFIIDGLYNLSVDLIAPRSIAFDMALERVLGDLTK